MIKKKVKDIEIVYLRGVFLKSFLKYHQYVITKNLFNCFEQKCPQTGERKKKRSPSEKSRIAPFLPDRQLWKWSGKGFKRPGAKGKGKKEFYKEIVRGKEHIRVSITVHNESLVSHLVL